MNGNALWNRIESRLDSKLPAWRERIDDLGQVAAVEKRSAGRTWSDDEVFKGLLLAVLSSNTDWSKIERIQGELSDRFLGFSLEWYAGLPDSEIGNRFVPWFKDKKAGSVTLARSLVELIDTARKLLEHSRAHGTAEDYFLSLMDRCGGDPKQVALCLGCAGEYKLPSFGVPLAAEALKNLGFDVAKPDRHVMRAVGSFGLVHFGRWSDERARRKERAPPAPTPERQLSAMATVEKIAEAAGEPVVFVDNAIWLLCAKSGLYLTNAELAEMASAGDSPEDHRGGLGALIRSWTDKGDTGEQRETIEHLVRALDEDRLSDRELFPRELKGKSW